MSRALDREARRAGLTAPGEPARASMDPRAVVAVIDDDVALLSKMAAYLTGNGFSVCLAENRFEGLKLIRKHRPMVIFIDDDIDRDDDEQMVKISKELDPDAKIFFMSDGLAAIRRANRNHGYGALAVLDKPLPSASVLRYVTQVVSEQGGRNAASGDVAPKIYGTPGKPCALSRTSLEPSEKPLPEPSRHRNVAARQENEERRRGDGAWRRWWNMAAMRRGRGCAR